MRHWRRPVAVRSCSWPTSTSEVSESAGSRARPGRITRGLAAAGRGRRRRGRAVERGAYAGGVGDHGAADEQRGHRDGGPDDGVGTTTGGPGPTDDRGPRPLRGGDHRGQRLELAADLGRRHAAGAREAGGRGLPAPARASSGGSPISRAIWGTSRPGQLDQEQGLALRGRQLGERVEGREDLGRDALLAVPDPGGVAALGVLPGVRPHGLLGVLEPRDLAPVVPGHDERVADGGPRGGEVAGEGIGLEQEPLARFLVERVEQVWVPHGNRPRYASRGGATNPCVAA